MACNEHGLLHVGVPHSNQQRSVPALVRMGGRMRISPDIFVTRVA